MDSRKEKDKKEKDGDAEREQPDKKKKGDANLELQEKGSKKGKKEKKGHKDKDHKTKSGKEEALESSPPESVKSSKHRHHRHKSKKQPELKKSSKGPSEFLPLIYDTSKKLEIEVPVPPPKPAKPKPVSPPKPVTPPTPVTPPKPVSPPRPVVSLPKPAKKPKPVSPPKPVKKPKPRPVPPPDWPSKPASPPPPVSPPKAIIKEIGWRKELSPLPQVIHQDAETEKKRDEALSKVKKMAEEAKKRRDKAQEGDFENTVEKLSEQINELLGMGPAPVETTNKVKDYHGIVQEDAMLKFGQFSIPQQENLLRLLYSSGNETRPCHFGGNMWDYYSNVLRCFTPINMQGRYRGAGLFAKSMTAIDVTKLKLKSEEAEINLQQRDEQSEREGDLFASVAVDAEHYLYLRQLWNLQPAALPVSHTYQLLCTMVPILQDLYFIYSRRLGTHHPVTVETHKRWDALKSKLESYIKLLLEPIERLIPRDPRFGMNEEELLNIVNTDYLADDEVTNRLKDRKSLECLTIPNQYYHDLLTETLEYRQKIEMEHCGPYAYDDD